MSDQKKCCIYARVSSEMQEGNFSISAQLRVCRDLAERRGWVVVEEYTDVATGRNTDRPGLKRMLKDAEAGVFDILIAYSMDRVSRSVENMLGIIRQLEVCGVSFVSATEPFDFTTPYGRVHLTMISTFNELYSNRLAEEVIKGQLERVKQGKWIGGVPYGYEYDANGDLKPNENAKAIKMIFEMLIDSYSLREIAMKLDEEGYKPVRLKSWSSDSVKIIAQNRSYTGMTSYQGKWYQGNHPALITDEEFKHARAEQSKRYLLGFTKIKRKSRIYILSGLIKCSENITARGVYSLYNGVEYRYYRCSKTGNRPNAGKCNCNLGSISADATEEALGILLSRIKLPEDWKNIILERLNEEHPKKADHQKKISKLQGELERLIKVFIKFGHMSEEQYLKDRAEIEDELTILHGMNNEEHRFNYDGAAEILGNFSKLWSIASKENQRELARKLVKRSVITVIRKKSNREKFLRLDVVLNSPFQNLISAIGNDDTLNINFHSYKEGNRVFYRVE